LREAVTAPDEPPMGSGRRYRHRLDDHGAGGTGREAGDVGGDVVEADLD
jgi:hypothetical protein